MWSEGVIIACGIDFQNDFYRKKAFDLLKIHVIES